ncbi:hypothetical protein MAR_018669 [Mya arenaria]|uniref:Uncharacterized protein n=1 Tax=Mya arenaria TaxID=6604 RepID=A0ABY7ENE1_MYAAR|nr:hypothetical protein MAR_018669 [Mya arenaria]
MEKLFRQDHSDVYFNNERLNEDLNGKIDEMKKDMYRQEMRRLTEIKLLQQEIKEGQEPGISGSLRTKSSRPTNRKRAQSAWARTGSGEKKERAEDEKPEEVRSPSPASTVSTLRNTRTLKRYQNIGAQRFKENGRFPEEWYIKCIPASDASVHNARMQFNKKKAPSPFNFLAKIREHEMTEKKLKEYTANVKIAKNGAENNEDEIDGNQMILMCEEPVKPVQTGLSRRQLRKIANDTKIERGPSRNTEKRLALVAINEQENKKIFDKVRVFCKKIEDLKAREIRKLREREEARKREEEERAYHEVIDEALKEEENTQCKSDEYR